MLSDRCSNTHYDDRWTCPGCYEDLPTTIPGRATCGNCGAKLKLSLEMVPECVSVVLNDDDDDDESE
jgi:transcription elongation factor Elf1